MISFKKGNNILSILNEILGSLMNLLTSLIEKLFSGLGFKEIFNKP